MPKKTVKEIFATTANAENQLTCKVKKNVLYGRWSRISKLSGCKLASFLYKKLKSGEIAFEYYDHQVYLRNYEKDNIINDDYFYFAIKPE